jgi:MFS family permease
VSTVVAKPRTHHALLAGFLGWTLDAFDFFVIVFLYDTLAREFSVSKKAIVFTTTATLALRPVGAVIFGLLADRFGRRVPLMANVIYFSIIELLCGFAPSYKVFLVLRALFGIGMGGEWGVGASLAMEAAPPKWRGILSGILQNESAGIGGMEAASRRNHGARVARCSATLAAFSLSRPVDDLHDVSFPRHAGSVSRFP